MDGASTPGTGARESQDTSALGTGKGGPRCVRRWLVLMLAPAQQKSLPLPACSPQWSAAAPFPLQHVCLPLALIPRALSPPPPSPAHPPVHRTARLPSAHALPHRPANVPAYIPARFTDALRSPPQLLAKTRVPPRVFAPPCPPRGCEQRGGIEMAGPGWAGTGHRDRCRAVDYSHGSCYPEAPAGCSHPPEKCPSPVGWLHPWEGHRGAPTAGIGERLAAPQVENHPAGYQ